MIKISNELLHDSAFDLASYIAARFGVCMGNAERAFFTGDGDKSPWASWRMSAARSWV